jgi:bidirectional [NiFe] hydrogenase diaphorase subunit
MRTIAENRICGDRMMATLTRPQLPSTDKRWMIVQGTMRKHGYSRNALIETLHTVQQSFGFLDKDAIRFVAASLQIPPSQAYGVATFYHLFQLRPPGRHTCQICLGTACYINGAERLMGHAEKQLGIQAGETTPDGEVSLLAVRCVGSCSFAPVSIFDEQIHSYSKVEALDAQLKAWTQP